VTLLEARPQGDGWIAQLEGVAERDAASRLTGQMILVERDLLPPTQGREHYREDLIGFEARNLEQALLGVVDHFVDTPGNAVMVIKGVKEHWVPVTPQHLRSVDKHARNLVVDWPEDF
jgi:16S rRNA processing protein RimM